MIKHNDLDKSFMELVKRLLRYGPYKREIGKELRVTDVNYFNSGQIETWFISLGSYGQAQRSG